MSDAPMNDAGQGNAGAPSYPPVGFKSPDGAQPPQQPGSPAPAGRPAGKPILRLVQKFWHACTTAPATPQAATVIGGDPTVIGGDPPVIAGDPTVISPPTEVISPPTRPAEVIRIEAAKQAGTWLFSTIPAPIGIEGMVTARDANEAIRKVSQAIRSLSVLCKHPDGLVSLALLVDPSALVSSTRMTPDIEVEKEGQHAQVV